MILGAMLSEAIKNATGRVFHGRLVLSDRPGKKLPKRLGWTETMKELCVLAQTGVIGAILLAL